MEYLKMTEFSAKCMEYLDRNQMSIYQLAKVLELGRTNVRKIIDGELLPDIEFVNNFCVVLCLTCEETQELKQYHQIEKIGKDTYYARIEIRNLLLDLQENCEKWKKKEPKPIQVQIRNNQEKTFQSLCVQLDVYDALRMAISQEVSQQEHPEIYMDTFGSDGCISQEILRADRETNKNITLHQYICFFTKDQIHNCTVSNIRRLNHILSFAFIFHGTYDAQYTYASGYETNQELRLWPHYLVTSTQVIQISNDWGKAIVTSDKNMVKIFQNRLHDMEKEYHPLFAFCGEASKAIDYYINTSLGAAPEYVIESHPCVAKMFPQDMIEENRDNIYLQMIVENLKACDESHQEITFFGIENIRAFIETGRLPEMYGDYFRICSIEERKKMMDCFIDQLETESWKSYLIKNDVFSSGTDFYMEILGKDKLVFRISRSRDEMKIIIIDEISICEAFLDFLENLKNSNFVYNEEETVHEARARIDEMFQKLQGR